MSTWLWAFVLIIAAWGAHWGAEQLVKPLKNLRKQWGLTASAGAAFLAIVTASPEVGINVTSVLTGSAEIGLGNLLGSNIISIPLMVTIAYFATRKTFKQQTGNSNSKNESHEQHLEEHILYLDPKTVTVLALPYLGILVLVAVLTLPVPWRGLQPIDGWIMLGAYLVFLAQAIFRGRGQGEKVEWSAKQIWLAIAGAAAIVVGAYFIVKATENIVVAFGISKVVGGLFITGIMSTAPEVFKTWSVSRGGEVTAGTTSVIADNAITMTVAFVPLALVSVPVQNFQLYWVNLLFVALMPILYIAFVSWGSKQPGFKRWQVLAFDVSYLIYMLVILLVIFQVI
ncbi:hypothetical protein J4760_12805 [Salinicoccus sp. ID82-1]|uniref:sodium:calcium antiporter n=1 Tax=Salinicoccus sp. ID82-1 TaxID=2820269 RepID=UPI001F2773E8|nr:hypothetical protein [Salinicoccus sp. ID82-1]MCG1010902.1 hypothetical protein [Salinicoccus sp. ID82-1]